MAAFCSPARHAAADRAGRRGAKFRGWAGRGGCRGAGPDSFDQSKEAQKYSYAFFGTAADGTPPAAGRWTDGPSLDGKSQFSVMQNAPLGEEPVLGPARPDSGAQTEQMA